MKKFAAIMTLLADLSGTSAAVSFMHDVAPVLLQRCAGCHGSKKSQGDFRLHTFDYLRKAVAPGKPDKSDIYLVLVDEDPDFRMPQKDDPLAQPDIWVIRQWIVEGARFDGDDTTATLRSQLPARQHPEPPLTYRVPVPVMALAFSPDGRELAVGGHHEVTVWDSESGRLLRRLKRLPLRIHTLRWKSDGKQLIVAGGSPGEYGELALVDASNGRRLQVFDTFEDIVLDAAFNLAGNRLAAVAADRRARAYNLTNGERIWEANVHADWVTSVAYSPDNRFVITTSRDQTAKVLQAETGALFTTFNGHRRQFGEFVGRRKVFDSSFDPVSGLALTVGEGKAIRVWDPIKAKHENGTAADMEKRFFKAGHTRYIKHGLDRPVFAMCLAQNTVYTAGGDAVARAFDFKTGKQLREFKGHTDWIYSLDCSTTTKRLATGAHDGKVHIWDTGTGALENAITAAPGFETQ